MNDNITEVPELTPEQEAFMKNMKPGFFMTIQVNMSPEGEIQASIVPVPIDLRIIEDFQSQMGPALEEENMKFVILKDRAFLMPIKTSSLILLK